uniref:TIM barrel protein n=1 Tax=Xanthomonas phaseoli TaxID=1985254 RepID=UPI00037CA48A
VMCPLNDGTAVSFDNLVTALKAMKLILEERGLTGLVEPLGFPVSSLRTKAEAVRAIDAAGGGDVYKLVHDTFHHHLAGETELFPERTGLVHISGVTDPAGYKGPYSFEPFATEVHELKDPAVVVKDSIDHISRAL